MFIYKWQHMIFGVFEDIIFDSKWFFKNLTLSKLGILLIQLTVFILTFIGELEFHRFRMVPRLNLVVLSMEQHRRYIQLGSSTHHSRLRWRSHSIHMILHQLSSRYHLLDKFLHLGRLCLARLIWWLMRFQTLLEWKIWNLEH